MKLYTEGTEKLENDLDIAKIVKHVKRFRMLSKASVKTKYLMQFSKRNIINLDSQNEE